MTTGDAAVAGGFRRGMFDGKFAARAAATLDDSSQAGRRMGRAKPPFFAQNEPTYARFETRKVRRVLTGAAGQGYYGVVEAS